jgi:hypothetical protein
MINGEYCTIGAEIDADLNTYYVVKVGETCDYLSKRADKQRLKIVWGHKKTIEGLPRCRKDCEHQLQEIACGMFGESKTDYRAAGYTEMFGNFSTAQEANQAAWELLWAVQADERFSGDEFWIHPKAVWPVRLRLDWAA